MAGTIPLSRAVTRIKPADEIEAEGEHTTLKRSMGLLALTMFSVGSIVGTGIFVILGEAVPKAGPAVLVSFVLAAVTCASSPFSYPALSGSIPVFGSSASTSRSPRPGARRRSSPTTCCRWGSPPSATTPTPTRPRTASGWASVSR